MSLAYCPQPFDKIGKPFQKYWSLKNLVQEHCQTEQDCYVWKEFLRGFQKLFLGAPEN